MGGCVSSKNKPKKIVHISLPENKNCETLQNRKESFDNIEIGYSKTEQNLDTPHSKTHNTLRKEPSWTYSSKLIEKTFEDEDIEIHDNLIRETEQDGIPIEYYYDLKAREKKDLVNIQDQREIVSEMYLNSIPNSSVLRLEIRFGQAIYGGTAVLIDPNFALTSRSNVYDINQAKWVDSLKVFVPQKSTEENISEDVRKAYVFHDCDLALLFVGQSLGRKGHYSTIKAIENEEELHDEKITVIGYPWKNNNNKSMFAHEGDLCEFDKAKFRIGYSTQASPGQSGSPILIESSKIGKYFLVGIHNDGNLLKDVNHGVLLNKERYDQIRELKEPITKAEEKLMQLQNKWGEIFAFRANKRKVDIFPYREETIRVSDKIFEELITDFISSWDILSKAFLGGPIIDLEECSKLTDDGLKQLSSRLQLLKGLKKFDLSLKKCHKISDKGVIKLAQEIGQNLKDIHNLGLSFYCCHNSITDASVIELITQIGQNLKNIKHLKLNFAFCENVTDAAVEEVNKQITKNMKDLEFLDLNFGMCRRITDDAINHLSKSLEENLKKVKSLDLNLRSRDWAVSSRTTLD